MKYCKVCGKTYKYSDLEYKGPMSSWKRTVHIYLCKCTNALVGPKPKAEK
jgi:hypothetical protein